MNKELLTKYLNNSCTPEEFDEVVNWIKTEAFNKEGKRLGFSDWKSFEPALQQIDKQKYEALLDKIHHEINLKTQKGSKVITMSKVASWLSRVAAILFIPLLGVVLYLLSNNNIHTDNYYTDLTVDSLEIIAPIGSRAVVQLSDGTEVNLNYGSKIKYPQRFSGNTRGVTLSGEAYFDVAHNPDKPFVVQTGKLDIKALGTEFNVQAYPDDYVVETTLVEGKVVLEETMPGEKAGPFGAMVPGQHVSYNLKSRKVTSSNGNTNKYVAWKDGKLVFDNESLSGVAEKLSRKFYVDIEVAENIKDYSYTVTFVDDPLFLILDLMTEVTDISYKTYPRKKLADGTFSKQKIRIEKRQ